jgi:hypothetical protein
MVKIIEMPSPPLTDPMWWEPPTRFSPRPIQTSGRSTTPRSKDAADAPLANPRPTDDKNRETERK